MKLYPYGLVAASLTFFLGVVLAYAAYGYVPTLLDGPFTDEEIHHCSQ